MDSDNYGSNLEALHIGAKIIQVQRNAFLDMNKLGPGHRVRMTFSPDIFTNDFFASKYQLLANTHRTNLVHRGHYLSENAKCLIVSESIDKFGGIIGTTGTCFKRTLYLRSKKKNVQAVGRKFAREIS